MHIESAALTEFSETVVHPFEVLHLRVFAMQKNDDERDVRGYA